MSQRPPSRALPIAAGVLTQLVGAACFVLGLASLPVLDDLHAGVHAAIASIVAALLAIACGSLAWGGRLVPLALAAGLDLGFGIALPRGSATTGALLRLVSASDAHGAHMILTALAIAMFVAAGLCAAAVPGAIARRRWAQGERERAAAELVTPADTLRGVGPSRALPTQVVRVGPPGRRSRPVIVLGVATTLVVVGGIAIFAASGSGAAAPPDAAVAGSAASARAAGAAAAPADAATSGHAPAADAALDAAPAPPFDALVARLHEALAHPAAAALTPLFAPDAFAFGTGAHELGEGPGAIAALVQADLGAGGKVAVRFAHVGQDGELAWLAEDLRIGDQPFVLTAVAGLDGGAWTFHALELAIAMPNATAHQLAHDADLAVPDAIPDTHDASPLADAMREAFASIPSFVAARSARPDAFNFGSAPGERITGGRAIAHAFTRLAATIHLHDAVKVGMIGERAGWGAANVDFTDADAGGTPVTQTFRVLAAWVHEDAGWRIVQTQFSNAR